MGAPAILTGSIVGASRNKHDEYPQFATLFRLILVLALGQFLIDYLIIMNSTGLIGIDLRKPTGKTVLPIKPLGVKFR